MPRRHKRRPNARRYGYVQEAMQNAICAVKESGMNIRQAALLHNVNRSTSINRLKNNHCGAVGRPTMLTSDQERTMVHAIKKLADWGFEIDRNAVQSIATDYLQMAGIGGKVGIDWLYGFEKRWKDELTRRVAQPLPASRAYACNPSVVDDFFQKLASTCECLNLNRKPQNIFNVDETGFQTDV